MTNQTDEILNAPEKALLIYTYNMPKDYIHYSLQDIENHINCARNIITKGTK